MDYNSYTFKNKVVDRLNGVDNKKKKVQNKIDKVQKKYNESVENIFDGRNSKKAERLWVRKKNLERKMEGEKRQSRKQILFGD